MESMPVISEALLLNFSKYMGVDEGDDDADVGVVDFIAIIASNGTDAPVLSIGERAELERVLEQIIKKLAEEDQKRVLSLWLHHFTYCSSSDWPNLHASYARWCIASRKQLPIHHS